MEHCGEKIEKAVMNEGEIFFLKVWHYEEDKISKRKVFFKREKERREWH